MGGAGGRRRRRRRTVHRLSSQDRWLAGYSAGSGHGPRHITGWDVGGFRQCETTLTHGAFAYWGGTTHEPRRRPTVPLPEPAVPAQRQGYGHGGRGEGQGAAHLHT